MEGRQQLFCPIRNQWVAALPEEQVRQRIIRSLIEQKGFPQELLSVEKALRDLACPSQRGSIPDRRIDLAAYCNKGGALMPLLLMECKAVPIRERTISQLVGYNHFVGAPFLCFVNQTEVRTGWFDPAASGYRYISFLPSYKELVSVSRKHPPIK